MDPEGKSTQDKPNTSKIHATNTLLLKMNLRTGLIILLAECWLLG